MTAADPRALREYCIRMGWVRPSPGDLTEGALANEASARVVTAIEHEHTDAQPSA